MKIVEEQNIASQLSLSLLIRIKPLSTQYKEDKDIDLEELEGMTLNLRNKLNQLNIIEKDEIYVRRIFHGL